MGLMPNSKKSMRGKFIVFSGILFFIILVCGSAAFFFSMRQIIRTNKANHLSQSLENMRIRLERFVMNEIAITKKMAGSPLIKDYFADPTDADLEKHALREIAAYREAFGSISVFWVNDKDKIFYSDDNAPFVVNPDSPDNYWYPMTLYKTESYNININYNPAIKKIKLWINAPVFDDGKKPIGMVGTGIELSKFVNALFNGADDRTELYYFNADGEITGARDILFISSKSKIDDAVDGVKGGVRAAAQSLAPGETRTFDLPHGNIVIGSIPQLDWYSVVYMPDSVDDYKTSMTVLFLVVLAVIMLIFVVFNVFVSSFLKTQQKTMESLERAKNEAETANRSKSNFLAAMSHEIRTPLNAIIGIAQMQLQERGNMPDDRVKESERIYDSGRRLLGIINNILDMSKIETGDIGADVAQQLRDFTLDDGNRAANLRISHEPMPYGSVLVVDDVSTNLYVAEGLLSRYKLTIETADSGFAAIEKVKGGKVYDVIFMDQMMPDMDGIDTMRKLRELGYAGAIVALTANALVGNDIMFMQKGFDGFISKPIDVRWLNDVLNKFVRDKYPEEAKKYISTSRSQSGAEVLNDRISTSLNDRISTSLNDRSVQPAELLNSALNPQILKYFINDAEKAIVTLRETMESGNVKLFTITAHAMKSALANVGENEASRAAAELEKAGHSGDTGFITANIGGFIKALELLVEKFGGAGGTDKADDVNKADDDGTAEDTDYLVEQLRIVKSACENYDDDTAYAALDRLKERQWKRSTAKSLEDIRDALFTSSDFDGAAGICGTLVGVYGNI